MTDGRWQIPDGKWQMTNARWQMTNARGLVLVLADVPLLLVWREDFVPVTDHRGIAAGAA
jgi:hypothetical protein